MILALAIVFAIVLVILWTVVGVNFYRAMCNIRITNLYLDAAAAFRAGDGERGRELRERASRHPIRDPFPAFLERWFS